MGGMKRGRHREKTNLPLNSASAPSKRCKMSFALMFRTYPCIPEHRASEERKGGDFLMTHSGGDFLMTHSRVMTQLRAGMTHLRADLMSHLRAGTS